MKGNGGNGGETRGTRFFDFAFGYAQNDNVGEAKNDTGDRGRGYFLSV